MWSAFVGYRFMKYFAVEAGYLDTGSASYTGSGTAYDIFNDVTVPVKANFDWKGTGWPVSVLGIWPINDNWDVFGRVGGFFGDVSVDLKLSDDTRLRQGAHEPEHQRVHLRPGRGRQVPGKLGRALRVAGHTEPRGQRYRRSGLERFPVRAAVQVLDWFQVTGDVGAAGSGETTFALQDGLTQQGGPVCFCAPPGSIAAQARQPSGRCFRARSHILGVYYFCNK